MIDRIERELLLPAAPDDVWEAVIGNGWLADEVRMDLRPGGDAFFRTEETVKIGWVEEVLEPRADPHRDGKLAFWWASEGEPASRVQLTIQARDGATRLHVVEARPLELLDLVGMPLPGIAGPSFGPALVAA